MGDGHSNGLTVTIKYISNMYQDNWGEAWKKWMYGKWRCIKLVVFWRCGKKKARGTRF